VVIRLLDCTEGRWLLKSGFVVISVERFTEGTELIGAAEVQLQSDLIR